MIGIAANTFGIWSIEGQAGEKFGGHAAPLAGVVTAT